MTAPSIAANPYRGVVLPVVLILLLILAFVGLFAARRSASVEEISNNARVNQVAWQSAQSGLRHCEAVVMDDVDGSQLFNADVRKRIQTSTLLSGPDDTNAQWDQIVNWAAGSTMLIEAPVTEQSASKALQGAPVPRCIAEALEGGRFLITARGLSAGSTFNANGQLEGGAEVWLQSIISPRVPTRSSEGGYE
jgi:type IV pilus assembly protein PilX